MLTAKTIMLKLIFTHILKQSVQYQGGGVAIILIICLLRIFNRFFNIKGAFFLQRFFCILFFVIPEVHRRNVYRYNRNCFLA